MSGVSAHLMGSLVTQLETFLAANTTVLSGCAYDNRPFDPPAVDGTKGWLRCSFFPKETEQATVGDDGLNEMAGIMLVNVFYPKGKDAGVPNGIADALVSAFKRGTNCPAVAGYHARVQKAWRDAALPDDSWFHIPVRVRYFQHVINT